MPSPYRFAPLLCLIWFFAVSLQTASQDLRPKPPLTDAPKTTPVTPATAKQTPNAKRTTGVLQNANTKQLAHKKQSVSLRVEQRDSLLEAYENSLNVLGNEAVERLSAFTLHRSTAPGSIEQKQWSDSIKHCLKHYQSKGLYLYEFQKVWYWKICPAESLRKFGNLFSDLEKEVAKLHQLDCDLPLETPDGELTDPRRIPPRLLICDRILMTGKNALRTQNMRPDQILSLRAQVEDIRNKCLFLLYFGSLKNPSTASKTNRIKGEFWNPIYEFTRAYPTSKSAQEMRLFLQMLESNEYQLSPEIKEDWMRYKSYRQAAP